jgi:hypothetical protein
VDCEEDRRLPETRDGRLTDDRLLRAADFPIFKVVVFVARPGSLPTFVA